MIQKRETCLYCGEKMESITAKKKFCSDLHRLYWNREQKMIKNAKAVIKEVFKTNIVTKVGILNSDGTVKLEPTAFELYQRKKLGLK